jgi:hypothetical protein
MTKDEALVQEPDLIARLTNPEDHYEFTDPKKANAVLMSLCQEAADALAAPVQPVALPTDAQIAATAGRIGGFSDEAALGKQWDDVYLLVRRVITEITTATPPAAPVQDLPFGVGGGLVAIKTLLSRDPCVHANTAIEMIDAILKEHPAAQRQWVGLTDEEMYLNCPNWLSHEQCNTWVQQIEAKLKEKNTAAQPAVPLTDEQKRDLIKKSALWDMHIHIGWYSAPAKSFVEKTIQLIADIEAAHGITKGQP